MINIPRYTYQCIECEHTVEKDFRIQDFDLTATVCCDKCGALAKRIISFNTGHRADPIWLPGALELLQPDGERPIESKQEFDAYKKKHNIVSRC